MEQRKQVTEGIWMLAIYILLLLVTLMIPILSIFSVFFLPIPFVLYTRHFNIKGGLSLLVGALVFSAFVIPIFSLPATVIAAGMGILLGYAIHQELSPYETIARGAAGFIMGLIVAMFISQGLFNVNWVTAIGNSMDDSIEMSNSLLDDMGVERTEEQTQVLEDQIQLFKDMLPAVFAIVGVVLSWIVQWIGYKILNRKEETPLRFPPIRSIRMPVFILWVYLFVMIGAMMTMDSEGTMYLFMNNLWMLLSFFILLQGISFAFHFAYVKRMPVVLPVIFTIMVLVFPLVLSLTRILGIIDIGFRLRDRLTPKG